MEFRVVTRCEGGRIFVSMTEGSGWTTVLLDLASCDMHRATQVPPKPPLTREEVADLLAEEMACAIRSLRSLPADVDDLRP